ncbi:hypothetical protein B296_00048950, partial [Ensete ventricosum]
MISCSRNPGVFAFSMPNKPGKVDHIFHFRSTTMTTVYKLPGVRPSCRRERFEMDEAFGSARVKVQFGDHAKNIEVVDSCPVNCIHWVAAEELPLLEFLVRAQPKQAY